MRTRLRKDSRPAPYPAQRPRHSARAAARLALKTRAPLAFLSPGIQFAIRDGTVPPELTLHRILQRPIPLDWQEQERLYGV